MSLKEPWYSKMWRIGSRLTNKNLEKPDRFSFLIISKTIFLSLFPMFKKFRFLKPVRFLHLGDATFRSINCICY